MINQRTINTTLAGIAILSMSLVVIPAAEAKISTVSSDKQELKTQQESQKLFFKFKKSRRNHSRHRHHR